MLRGIQAIAYLAPALCPGDNEIALHVVNLSGFHVLTPDSEVVMIEYSIIGRLDDGSYVVFPEDQNLRYFHDLKVGMETISCVRSEARKQGIGSFVVGLEDVGLPVQEQH